MEDPAAPRTSVGADRCSGCGHEVGTSWLVCAWCGHPLAAPAELPVGARLCDGRYEVLGVLGRGGFGITYEMADDRLERRVAVKELYPESAVRHGSLVLTPPQARPAFAEARERFLREARVLARFTHPGIVRVYEVFEEHGTAYLVMELLQGRSLLELLASRGRPFDGDEVIEVATRVAAALRPVHAADVLHRDVNPSNVMLTDGGRVVLIDFGLARVVEPAQTTALTRVVTPGYAPLEQYRGEGRFGPFTDVYGLAATCYRLATGVVPTAALDRDGGAELPHPSRLNPAIPKAVGDAVMDGLELEPAHRPQTLDAFLARLGVGSLPVGVRSPLIDAFPPTPTAPPRHPAAPTAATSPWVPVPTAAPEGAGGTATPTAAPMAAPGDPDATAVPAMDDTATRGHGASPADSTRLAEDRPPRTSTVLNPDGTGRVIGPGTPGMRKVTIPLIALALAAAAVAPVLAVAGVVLVALPVLATVGAIERNRLRRTHGLDEGMAGRVPVALRAPAMFVANVVRSLLRASPVLVIGAVLLAGWFGLDRLSDSEVVVDAALRLVGLVVMGLVLAASRQGSERFPTGLGLEVWATRLAPAGRTTQAVLVLWIVAVLVVAGAAWLSPDVLPL